MPAEQARENIYDIRQLNSIMDQIHEHLPRVDRRHFNEVFKPLSDANDKVNFEGLKIGFQKIGCPELSSKELRTIYRHFDSQDGNGVNYQELAWLLFNRRQLVREMSTGTSSWDVGTSSTTETPTSEQFDDPMAIFAEGNAGLANPYKMQEQLKKRAASPCWMSVANPVPKTGFGPSVFAPKTIAPYYYKSGETNQPLAESTGRSSAMQAERPMSLQALKRPLPWFKERQLRQKMQQTINNEGFTQNLRLALHKDDNIDPEIGNRRLFPIASQQRRALRIARFTTGNNRHATDYGKAEQERNAVPESVKRLEKPLQKQRLRRTRLGQIVLMLKRRRRRKRQIVQRKK